MQKQSSRFFKFTLAAVLFLAFSLNVKAQYTRYIIQLKDKGNNPFTISNPSQYLSQRALDRRTRYNIAIDSTDLPVTPRYIDSIRLAGLIEILNVSRWLNQVAIRTSDPVALTKINAFPFVLNAAPIAARNALHSLRNKFNVDFSGNPATRISPAARVNSYYDYGQSANQVKLLNCDFLHDHGFRGEGMQLAMLDGGFYHYLSLPTFDSIRSNNQVLGTWDFVANETGVDEDNSHGMQCLSTIAANLPGTFIGSAPKTSFYLFRTEDVDSEYPIEEQNWAAGIERADSAGADVSSTSLGYYDFDDNIFDHTYADLDGNTTISARAADIAAKKGILVVGAVGNEGNSAWHYLITPSDADSTLSVGAVDIAGNVASFSSYGPSSDGQIKPSVAAVGSNTVVANANTGQPVFSSGTSFACPTMAGVATCLWQAFPEENNMAIINALEQSATKASNPDNHIGYGIPDAKKAFVILQKKSYKKTSGATDCNLSFGIDLKTDNSMQVIAERKLQDENDFTVVASLQNHDGYGLHHFMFDDPLSNIAEGLINYRLMVKIASDTTFILDSFVINHDNVCGGLDPINEITIIQTREAAENVTLDIKRITQAKMNIVIQNAAGQKVYAQELQLKVGSQKENLELLKILPSRGVYYLTLFVNNKKVRTKQILRP